MPLSRRAIQLSPLILTLATFSTPCHHWKGSGLKKGVCVHCSTPWVLPLGVLPAQSAFIWGVWAPFFSAMSLLCSLNVDLFSMLLPMGSHRWSGPSCYSDSSISLPFGHLSWPSPGAPWIPLWHLWYHQGPSYYPSLHPSWHSLLPNVPSIQQVF